VLQIAIELSLEVRHERRQLRGPCDSRHPFDGAELGHIDRARRQRLLQRCPTCA